MTQHNSKHDMMIDVEAMAKQGIYSAHLSENL